MKDQIKLLRECVRNKIPAYGYVPRRSVCNGPNPPGRVQSPLQLPAVPPGVRGYAGIPSSFHRALLLKEPAQLSSSRMFSFYPVAGTESNRESWLDPELPAFHFSTRKADSSAMLSVKAVPVSLFQ